MNLPRLSDTAYKGGLDFDGLGSAERPPCYCESVSFCGY